MHIDKNQKIITKWNSHNKKHFINKGYKFTKIGDNFELKNICDVYKGTVIQIKCNYCGCILYKTVSYLMCHFNINSLNELLSTDIDIACKHCANKKIEKIMIEKYGVKNAFQAEEIKQKIKQTNLEKYGVEYPNQCKEIRNKIEKTNLERYGYKCPSQCQEIIEKTKQTNLDRYGCTCTLHDVNKQEEIVTKIKQTNLQKYGVEYPFQNDEVRKKSKDTMLKKYGYTNSLQSPIVRKKIYITKYKNKSMPCSKNQLYISELLDGIINYPIELFFLDIAFPEEMIYIEYDGGGHDLKVKMGYEDRKTFDYNQIKRKFVLENKGWKLIRIISKKDKLYDDDKLLNLINEAKDYLLNTIHTWVEIDIDNNEYRCKEYIKGIK